VSDKNYIKVDGNGNIVLQDITGKTININDIEAMKKIFESTEPEYIAELLNQIKQKHNSLVQANENLLNKIIELLSPPENNKSDTDKLKNLLSTNNYDLLFEKLKDSGVDQNAVLMLNSQWNEIKEQKMYGLINQNEERNQVNQLRFRVLNLINTIK